MKQRPSWEANSHSCSCMESKGSLPYS